MKTLLLIVFVVTCAIFAEPAQHAGGLMNGDGSYIPGILMVHNDVNQFLFMNGSQNQCFSRTVISDSST